MKKDSVRKKRIHMVRVMGAAAILIAVLAAGFAFFRIRAAAAVDEKKTLTYADYTKNHKVEDSVLFIGTYLIHKDVLTDDLYTAAMATASADTKGLTGPADPGKICYKSEFAGGSWFDITDAGSLSEITGEGDPISEEDLGPRLVQYYVGSDGILLDALTNEEKNPFSLTDPYDLINLPELETLRQLYTYDLSNKSISEEQFLEKRNSEDNGELRTGVYYYQVLTTFFNLDLSDAETKKLDSDLDRLYQCYKSLKAAENDGEAEIVYELMAKVDATRRSIVMDKLVDNAAASEEGENGLSVLFDLATGSNYTSLGNFKDAETGLSEEEKAAAAALAASGTDPNGFLTELKNAVKHDFFEPGKGLIGSLMNRIGLSTGDWWSILTPDSLGKKKKDEGEEGEEEEDEEEEEKGEPFRIDNNIVDAIGTCQTSCQESLSSLVTKRLSDGDSVLSHAEYENSMAVIEGATAAGLDASVIRLKMVRDIAEGTITDAEGELAYLEGTLIPLAESHFSGGAAAGASEGYAAAAANGKGEAAMESELNSQKDALDADRSELQYLISERNKRTGGEEALNGLMRQLDMAEGWRAAVKNDAFAVKGRQSVDDFSSWLKDEARSIKTSDESLSSELDRLKAEKDELTKSRQSALDDNDLSLAADYEAQIAAKDQDIAAEEERLAAEKDKAQSAGERASALLDLGDSMDALADRILDRAKGRISEGDFDGVSNSLAALSGIGALSELEELKDLLKGTDAPASLKDAVDKAIDENGGDSGAGGGESGGSGEEGAEEGAGAEDSGEGGAEGAGESGAGDNVLRDKDGVRIDRAGEEEAGTGEEDGDRKTPSLTGTYTRDALLSKIADLFGDPDSLSDENMAAVITALSRYGEDGVRAARSLAREFTGTAVEAGNPYLYEQYREDAAKQYVSVETIANVTNYRYLYSDTRQKAALTKGGSIYEFTVGSKTGLHGGEEITLKNRVVFQTVPYLSSTDAGSLLKCDARYVEDTAYAVCVTEKVESKAEELYQSFLE